MIRLSDAVNDATVAALRERVAAGEFPGVPFERLLEFLLWDHAGVGPPGYLVHSARGLGAAPAADR
jgi:hypothetical protein